MFHHCDDFLCVEGVMRTQILLKLVLLAALRQRVDFVLLILASELLLTLFEAQLIGVKCRTFQSHSR